MKRLRGCLVLIVVTVFFFPLNGNQCPRAWFGGWFGDKCQYRCNCRNNNMCDSNGECPGRLCKYGWFGPQCQYLDVAHVPEEFLDYVSDHDDSTCGYPWGQDFSALKPFPPKLNFTWMRIVLMEPGRFYTLDNITFRALDFRTHVYPLSNLTRIQVSDTTLDVYGSLPEKIGMVYINFADWDDGMYLCSVYISGGRSLALKQQASLSSTYRNWNSSYGPHIAVDGSLTRYKKSQGYKCTNTNHTPNNYWALTFSRPVHVERYIITTGRDYSRTCRLHYFHLESSSAEGNFIHKETSLKRIPSYVFQVWQEQPMTVRTVNISVSPSYWPGGKYDCPALNETFIPLVLCEVEIYGEYICAEGTWGIQCTETCHHCIDNKCMSPNGMCLLGCAPGYSGYRCLPPGGGDDDSNGDDNADDDRKGGGGGENDDGDGDDNSSSDVVKIVVTALIAVGAVAGLAFVWFRVPQPPTLPENKPDPPATSNVEEKAPPETVQTHDVEMPENVKTDDVAMPETVESHAMEVPTTNETLPPGEAEV